MAHLPSPIQSYSCPLRRAEVRICNSQKLQPDNTKWSPCHHNAISLTALHKWSHWGKGVKQFSMLLPCYCFSHISPSIKDKKGYYDNVPGTNSHKVKVVGSHGILYIPGFLMQPFCCKKLKVRMPVTVERMFIWVKLKYIPSKSIEICIFFPPGWLWWITGFDLHTLKKQWGSYFSPHINI